MKQKIEKKYKIAIIILIIAVSILSLLIQHFPSESKEQDKINDSIFVAISVSVMGALLMILKVALDDKYVSDSLQLLLLYMIPISAFIPLLADPKIFWNFLIIYFVAVIAWFLSADYFIIKPRPRDKEQNDAAKANITVFFALLGLSIFLFFLYFVLILPQLDFPTNGH